MQNNKNLILFLVLSVLIVLGWTYFNIWWAGRHRVPPTQPKPDVTVDKDWPFAKLSRKNQDTLVAELAVASLAGGSGFDLPGLAEDVRRLARYLPPPQITPLVEVLPPPKDIEVKSEMITLGDKDFFLKVELDSKGA